MQPKKEEKKQLYEVVLFRNDGEHIIATQTEKYDSAFECWDKLTRDWTLAIKEKIPFIMKEPLITSFDPGLVKEILLRPLNEVPEAKYDNPYSKKMMREGLSGMIGTGSEILDGGYR
jgi:hypothetical protein